MAHIDCQFNFISSFVEMDMVNYVRTWVWQRMSALFMLAYAAVWIWHLTCVGRYPEDIRLLLEQPWMRWFTIVCIALVAIHAWIGCWIVLTDYVHHHATRFVIQWILSIWLLSMPIAAVHIFL